MRAEEDLARAEPDRRAPGEDRGTDHPARSAQDPEATCESLVKVARPRELRRGDERAGDEVSRRRRESCAIEVERREPEKPSNP